MDTDKFHSYDSGKLNKKEAIYDNLLDHFLSGCIKGNENNEVKVIE